MLNPNQTKSVFWLIVVVAVLGFALLIYMNKDKFSSCPQTQLPKLPEVQQDDAQEDDVNE